MAVRMTVQDWKDFARSCERCGKGPFKLRVQVRIGGAAPYRICIPCMKLVKAVLEGRGVCR